MADLTARQAEVLAFINEFRSREQSNPTQAELADHFGWASQNPSATHLQALERKGVIVKRPTGRYVVAAPFDVREAAHA